jgi:hypothetical protein
MTHAPFTLVCGNILFVYSHENQIDTFIVGKETILSGSQEKNMCPYDILFMV